MAKDKDKLNKKQEDFINEYFLNGQNAAAAYKKIYQPKSDKNISYMSYRLLHEPKIQKVINERKHIEKELFNIARDDIISNLNSILNADITDYYDFDYDEDGNVVKSLKKLDKLPIEARKAIKKISKNKFREEEVELYDRMDAVKELSKLNNYYEQYTKIDMTIDTSVLDGLTPEELMKIAFSDDDDDDE